MKKFRALSWLMAVVIFVGMLASPLTADAVSKNVNPAQAREDFYEAVDKDIISSMKISDDASGTGWFYLLREQVDEELKNYIENCAANLDSYDKTDRDYQVGALYQCVMDKETRNAYRYGTIGNEFLSKVDRAQNIEELLGVTMEMDRTYGLGSLILASYDTDIKNVGNKVLYVSPGPTFLNKENWYGEDDYSAYIREVFRELIARLQQINGKSEEEAYAVADQISALCRQLSAGTYDVQEYYNPDKLYNVYHVSDLRRFYNGRLPMDEFCRLYDTKESDKFICSVPAFMEEFGRLLTEENLPLWKEYVKTVFYYYCSDLTDMESQEALAWYQQQQGGAASAKAEDKMAVDLVKATLNDFCSQAYVENCFDQESKAEVEEMVAEVLDVYRVRLLKLDWMQDTTKAEAVKKIDNMTVKVGYPDKWPSYLDSIRVYSPAEGGNLLDNVLNLYRIFKQASIESKDKPVDRKEWSSSDAFTVNAFYAPNENAIYFPAGILQAPFYDKNASAEENLGGIGTVIGHETTHAFDNSGAKYDYRGSYRNWWTDEDLEKFDQLTQKIVTYYDGYENAGLQVSGTLTLGENIADLGGVSAITEIAKNNNLDMKELYKQYAWIWALKYTPEATKMLMLSDVHAPGKVRVNAVLSSTPEFYEAFGVVPGDGMYKAPEERVRIW